MYGDIILISPYNSLLTKRIDDGDLLEIVPRHYLVLKAVFDFSFINTTICNQQIGASKIKHTTFKVI